MSQYRAKASSEVLWVENDILYHFEFCRLRINVKCFSPMDGREAANTYARQLRMRIGELLDPVACQSQNGF